jgi:O-antigen ligase
MTAQRLPWLANWPAPFMTLATVTLAFAGGLLLAGLPLVWASILLFVALVVSFTWIEPMVGVGAILFFGPFKPLTEYFTPSLPLDLGQWFLISTLAAWVARRVSRRESIMARSPLTLPLGLFIFFATLSLAGAASFQAGLGELVKWLQLTMTVWLVIQVAGERRWQWVVALALFVALFQAGIGIWQFFRDQGPDHFLILDERFYRAYGTLEQPNPYGGLIGMSLPLAVGVVIGTLGSWLARAREIREAAAGRGRAGLAERLMPLLNWRLLRVGLAGLLAGVIAIALAMSWSRGAWLGAGAAGLMILFVWPRRVWLGTLLVTLAVLSGVFVFQSDILPDEMIDQLHSMTEFFQSFDVRGADISPESYSVIERLAHWQTAVAMARDYPWLGVGFGNYPVRYDDYAFPNWPLALGHAHNYYLNVLAEVGLLGLGAYVWLWVVVVIHTFSLTRSRNVWTRGIAIGLLGTWAHLSVHNSFDNLWVSNLFLHVGALLGVLSILIVMERNVPREQHI